MSIVLITIPGDERSHFAHELSRRAGVKLDLVIVQRHKRKAFKERIRRFFARSLRETVIEAYYGFLLRFHPGLRRRLRYFLPTGVYGSVPPHPATVEVDSVNGEDVRQALTKLSPDLLVVWGNTILDKKVLSSAKRAINLHFGLCPYYRGALANQYAVISDDLGRLGATIHFVEEKPDTGKILATIPADASLPPEELFQDLHERAVEKYLEIIHALARGEDLVAKPQADSSGRNLLLRDWKPSVRYKLAKKMVKWEREHRRP